MVGRWLQQWRARREAAAVQRRAIPDDLWKRTLVRYPFLRRRDEAAAAELRRLTSLFLDRKEFSAVGGLRLQDAMVVAIAAQAVLPVLRIGLQAYDSFVGIVVTPEEVRAARAITDADGVVHEFEDELHGESVAGGPMMLSWRHVRGIGVATEQAAYNVVIHEFAHVIDMTNGLLDGMPLLPPDMAAASWLETLGRDYEDFVRRVDAEQPTVIDPYGAEAPEEFFGVACEAFFVEPWRMRDEHPALYGMFVRYFRQDPAADRPPVKGKT
jgi:Mlc titration factor MtfA (ptsG expression regulator)